MRPPLQYLFSFSFLPDWVINYYTKGFKEFVYKGIDFLEEVFDKQLDKFLEAYPEYSKDELGPTPVSKSGKLFEFDFFKFPAKIFITETPYKKGTLEKILWIYLPMDESKVDRIPTPTPIMIGIALYNDHARFFGLSEINVNKFSIHEVSFDEGDPLPKFKDHGLTKIDSFTEKVFILACNDETRKFNIC